MEGILNDLDLIRTALARSLHQAAVAKNPNDKTEEREEDKEAAFSSGITSTNANNNNNNNKTQKSHENTRQSAVPTASPANPTDTTAEMARLREQVSQLSAVELERARLEVELAAQSASLRQLSQSHHALSQQLAEEQQKQQQATCALQEREAALTLGRERHQRLQREAALLQCEQDALAAQCGRLECAVRELREALQHANSTNHALRTSLSQAQAACAEQQQLQSSLAAAVARETALRAAHESLRQTLAETQADVTAARVEVEERRQYWTARSEEHTALQEALAEAKAAVKMWEARFLTECAAPAAAAVITAVEEEKEEGVDMMDIAEPNQSNSYSNTEKKKKKKREMEEKEEGDDNDNDNDDKEAHLSALEAKIVDLALHLSEQRVAAETANASYEILSAAVKQENHELLDARRRLAAHEGEWKNLTETNQKLQAALLARESHVEALQELMITLLDELTEQSIFCYTLESQLALKSLRENTSTPTQRGGGGGGPRRSTALQLLQQQQRIRGSNYVGK
ncbi:uncharacterized protein TM35_000121620 [Trypanosoma theileri]|uniref:Uncharacterized protein n=1 Tax=Trypanosoma theileri TaxID=67003 RepID=A0A1X0NXG8_9TRYP|nr:uncharacterized protein TM35_000121620 [Trypanosoma theileri]ORC89387.1 hypothetical protein TM35_000121620 [Trypanosoma theileri]